MILFLLTFLLVYGLMHLYVFLKVRAAIALGRVPGAFLGLFMAFMVLVPIIVRTSERAGFETFAMSLSYTGYVWMGILFIFISWSFLIDLYRVCMRLYERLSGRDISLLVPSAKHSLYLPLIFALCTSVYGYLEAGDVTSEHVVVLTSKMPEGVGRLRIVQISDVHIGLIVRGERLERILDKVRSAGPDIFVSTGDLVDGQIDGLDGLSGLFREIDAPYGKFAIPGNHEYYAGFSQSADFILKSGFRLLEGEGVTIPGLINIAGVDDPAAKRFGLYTDVPETEILSGLDRKLFTLLLKHLPLVEESSLGMFDLQLSGHTHRGQIFPFRFVVQLFFPRVSGHFDLDHGSSLYVSRGSGTWGPPIRFLSPPEITVIDLVRER